MSGLPSEMRAHLEDAGELLDAHGNWLEFVEFGNATNTITLRVSGAWNVFSWGDIWHQARSRKASGYPMSDRDLETFVGLLKSMMQWHPEARPSTSEFLEHEWWVNGSQ